MPKFYVQSGSLKMVLQAKDSRSAAIWAAHRTLGQSLEFLCDNETDYAAALQQSRLGETITVSQQGYAGSDRIEFRTLEVVREWNQLLAAIDRLQTRLLAAADRRDQEIMGV